MMMAVLGITVLSAQDRDRDRDQDQDRLMLVDGEVLQIRDRDQVRLQESITLEDGTVVHPDGSYTNRNQAQVRIRDGECLDMEGNRYENEYQYRRKIKQENEGLTQSQLQQRTLNRFHFMNINGEMFQIRNQEQQRIQEPQDLTDGTTVNPDGSYQVRGRKQKQLQEGECISPDGQLFKNTYRHRKMVVQKNIKAQKKMGKAAIGKKPGNPMKKKGNR